MLLRNSLDSGASMMHHCHLITWMPTSSKTMRYSLSGRKQTLSLVTHLINRKTKWVKSSGRITYNNFGVGFRTFQATPTIAFIGSEKHTICCLKGGGLAS